MVVRVCVAGATGWTGSAVARKILASNDFQLVGAVARKQAGIDVGESLGVERVGLNIVETLEQALTVPTDVLIDYTSPASVKSHILKSLDKGVRVVVGTSGLTAGDFEEIERKARASNLGVIAAGNFSITAALAKHFALIAAKFLPSWEIIDYASAKKIDAPSGTTSELAEALGAIAENQLGVPIEQVYGSKDARGTTIAGTQVHSIRLPGYVIAFETIFGLPDERLSIRHDAGSSAEPYVGGTLLAASKVMEVRGLVRGLDQLLFK